jgi:competence protein ComGC
LGCWPRQPKLIHGFLPLIIIIIIIIMVIIVIIVVAIFIYFIPQKHLTETSAASINSQTCAFSRLQNKAFLFQLTPPLRYVKYLPIHAQITSYKLNRDDTKTTLNVLLCNKASKAFECTFRLV